MNIDVDDDRLLPDWVKARQIQSTDKLRFSPVRRSRAKPLDHALLVYALNALGEVVDAYELPGLDIWFVYMIRQGTGWDIILYEYMGEWKCSSITRRQ